MDRNKKSLIGNGKGQHATWIKEFASPALEHVDGEQLAAVTPTELSLEGKGMHLAVEKAAADAQLDGQNCFLQELVEFRVSVYENQELAQGMPERVRRQGFANLRGMTERWRAFNPTPEKAALLAEIELCIG